MSTTHGQDLNVRKRRLYALWAQVATLIANVDSTGTPTDLGAKEWIGYFNDTSTLPTGVDPDALAVKAGAILDCAMEATRATDMGPPRALAIARGVLAGCYFESNATWVHHVHSSRTSDASRSCQRDPLPKRLLRG